MKQFISTVNHHVLCLPMANLIKEIPVACSIASKDNRKGGIWGVLVLGSPHSVSIKESNGLKNCWALSPCEQAVS